MVIQFKKAIFLNFGYTQTIETLWRMGRQIEQHWNKSSRAEALRRLHECITFLKDHRDPLLQQLSQQLQRYIPITNEQELTYFNMSLEKLSGKELKDPDFLISTTDTTTRKASSYPLTIVLDNLRSAYNVGSILRSAEALGASRVLLCGLTPTPDKTKTSRTALGSDHWIPWNYYESTLDALRKLKESGHTIYALETAQNATDIEQKNIQWPAALVLGNERYGIPPHLLKECNYTVSIPMRGRKNSLNVGVCAGIAIYSFIKNLT